MIPDSLAPTEWLGQHPPQTQYTEWLGQPQALGVPSAMSQVSSSSSSPRCSATGAASSAPRMLVQGSSGDTGPRGYGARTLQGEPPDTLYCSSEGEGELSPQATLQGSLMVADAAHSRGDPYPAVPCGSRGAEAQERHPTASLSPHRRSGLDGGSASSQASFCNLSNPLWGSDVDDLISVSEISSAHAREHHLGTNDPSQRVYTRSQEDAHFFMLSHVSSRSNPLATTVLSQHSLSEDESLGASDNSSGLSSLPLTPAQLRDP